jgi:uncharacterized protein (TIGR00159 family)
VDFGTYTRYLAPLLDVAIVYFLIYRLLLIIKGTRAVPMLIGLLAIILLYFVSQESYLGLSTFNWILEQFIGSLFLIIVVLFQSDLRRALQAFGQTQFLSSFSSGSEAQVVDELVKASVSLANQGIGALIVVEREADLRPYMQEATRIDARISKELLYSIFVPERQNPLHDGAVVVREGRVAAGGVFLPMSVNPQIDRMLGTRHRAALGLSEETDALVIVVSEERSSVSVAVDGRLEQDVKPAALRDLLMRLLIRRPTRLFKRERGVVSVPPGRAEEGTRPPASKTNPPRKADTAQEEASRTP